jgi:F-type H+-transporting ATPase subunit epsilon
MADKFIKFSVVMPDRVVYEDSVREINIPTKAGYITVLPQHAGLISTLSFGEMTIRKGGYEVKMAVTSGILEVRPDGTVVVLADTAEHLEDMDVEAIKQAKERAEKILHEQESQDEITFARAEEQLAREIARLKIATKNSR